METTDFGDTFATAEVLPDGTCDVEGALDPTSDADLDDYLKFNALPAGNPFTLDFTLTNIPDGLDIQTYRVLTMDSAETELALSTGMADDEFSFTDQITGIIPADGMLFVRLEAEGEGPAPFSLQLSAVPEPGSLSLLGIAAAAAMGTARRRRKDTV